jgi:phage tail-like protein
VYRHAAEEARMRRSMASLGVVALSALTLPSSAAGPTGTARAYTEGRYTIELDGTTAALLKAEEGGYATADVVVEKIGSDRIAKKHVGPPRYEDISLEVGAGMSKNFWAWIKDTMDHKFSRKDGAVVAANAQLAEVSRLSFYHALITEIAFPELDASNRDPFKLSIKLAPEYTRQVAGSGKPVNAGAAVNANKGKTILLSGFRMAMDGLDCTHVSGIDPIVIKQHVVADQTGQARDYLANPGSLDFGNLGVYLPESFAKSFYDWHESFVIKGQNGDDKEKNGKIEILGQNMEPLITIELRHAGIFRMTPEKVEAGSDNIRRVKAQMYVESMALSFAPSWQ